MVKVKEDLTGKVFGRLTVIKQAEDYISYYLKDSAPQRHLFKQYKINKLEVC